jgi:hypothetical protein
MVLITAVVAAIFFSGALGGLINALIADGGLTSPKRETIGGVRVVRPGAIGNAFTGGVAALANWGLNSPSSAVDLKDLPGSVGLTPAIFAAAILVGVGGAKLLVDSIDKKLLKVSVSVAASKPADKVASNAILAASAQGAARIVKQMDSVPEQSERLN